MSPDFDNRFRVERVRDLLQGDEVPAVSFGDRCCLALIAMLPGLLVIGIAAAAGLIPIR